MKRAKQIDTTNNTFTADDGMQIITGAMLCTGLYLAALGEAFHLRQTGVISEPQESAALLGTLLILGAGNTANFLHATRRDPSTQKFMKDIRQGFAVAALAAVRVIDNGKNEPQTELKRNIRTLRNALESKGPEGPQ